MSGSNACPRGLPSSKTNIGDYRFGRIHDPPRPGCNKAVDEFLSDKPEKVKEIESDNYLKYYIQKIPTGSEPIPGIGSTKDILTHEVG